MEKLVIGVNDLQTVHPELAAEWDYEKNGDLKPTDVSFGMHRKVFWRCSVCNYTWSVKICARSNGAGCKKCGIGKSKVSLNKTLLKERGSFEDKYPDIAKEWHPTKNGDLKPSDVSCGSHREVWWLCKHGHEWKTILKDRIRSNGCPYCQNKSVLKGFNDLTTVNPKLASEWNYDKNDNLTPYDVLAKSNKKVWWLGKCGHEWQATIYERANGTNCPYCSNEKLLTGFNDLETRNPELLKDWDYEENGNLKPCDIIYSTNRKVFWKCSECGNKWSANVYTRTKGTGCPKCGIVKRTKSSYAKLLETKGSFADNYPEIALEWNYEKNGDLKPCDVAPHSGLNVWWKCSFGHEWKTKILARSNGHGCPYCARQKTHIKRKRNNTISNKLAKEFHPHKNGDIKPSDVYAESEQNIWWIGKCGHEWEDTPYHRKHCRAGCPYCTNRKVLLGFNDVATKNPNLVKELDFDKNGEQTPYNTAFTNRNKVWWICSFGHSYQSIVAERCGIRHAGCPVCTKEIKTSFPEQALYYYIKKYYNDAINEDRNAIGMELDIYIPSIKTAIEYDGIAWHNSDAGVDRELRKNKLCKDNNIHLIRIRENGLELYDDCYCITRENTSRANDISDIIKDVLLHIDNNLDLDIDIDRDSTQIYNSYISTHKEKSLSKIYPDIAEEWHPTKNGTLTPDMVTPSSTKKVWWICKLGHEYQTQVSYKTDGVFRCPICSGHRVLVGFNDLATTHPEIAEEWHPTKNGDLKPTEVSRGSNKYAWWKCKDGHEWKAQINSRTSENNKCPYCSKYKPKRVICIETGIIYNSLVEAKKQTGANTCSISACCKGTRNKAGGFHWKYAEDDNDI